MLDCQKHLFSLPSDSHYLNCASRAPLLKSAEAAGIEGIIKSREPIPKPPSAYFEDGELLRHAIGELINAHADRIALIPAVSFAMAIARQNVVLGRGDRLVTVEEEFPSNVYPWLNIEEAFGALRTVVPRPAPDAPAGAWTERVLEAIDSKTRLVVLSHVQWTDGASFDLGAIATRAREVGAYSVFDGTQSIGAMGFNFTDVQPDLLVVAAYKWLLGPYQIGFAAFGERLLEGRPLEDHWSNRAGAQDTSSTDYRPEFRRGARKFDVGEHANPITVPMFLAGVRQLVRWGPESIATYNERLVTRLEDGISDQSILLPPRSDRAPHIIGLRFNSQSKLNTALDAMQRRRIRVSKRGDALRVSPNVYNDIHDIDALLHALPGH